MKRQKSHKFISFFLLSFFHQIEVVGALRMTNWRLKDMRMRRVILHSLEALYLKDSMSLEYESAMPIPYCILFYFFPPNKRPQMKIILLLFFEIMLKQFQKKIMTTVCSSMCAQHGTRCNKKRIIWTNMREKKIQTG